VSDVGAVSDDGAVSGDGAATGDVAATGDASHATAEAGTDGLVDGAVTTEVGVDLGPTTDTRPADLGGSDVGPDADARSTADAGGPGGPLDFGTPRGGALSCSTGGSWTGSAVFGLVLLGLARRRRRLR
jgi:MYXO-CTERM domain-containing protein